MEKNIQINYIKFIVINRAKIIVYLTVYISPVFIFSGRKRSFIYFYELFYEHVFAVVIFVLKV